MKIYYDGEFTGLHKDSTFISIGMISESGRTFYAEFNDFNKMQVNEWIQKNVIDKTIYIKQGNLSECDYSEKDILGDKSINILGNSSTIREKLLDWLYQEYDSQLRELGDVVIYSDCYAYDWVLLCSLLGGYKGAMGMPNYVSIYPIDLASIFQHEFNDPDINREEFCEYSSGNKHNSLDDAKMIKLCFEKLDKMKQDRILDNGIR
jgi:hypothetical protein